MIKTQNISHDFKNLKFMQKKQIFAYIISLYSCLMAFIMPFHEKIKSSNIC